MHAELGPLYKVTDENGRACNGGSGVWPLPVGDAPGEWRAVEDELVPCERGLHVCRREDLVHWLGPVIWTAEIDGEYRVEDTKIVARRGRLVTRVTTWTEQSARLFAADCAERALVAERAAGREPDSRAWQAVAVARAYARGEVTAVALSAARSAAESAARSASWFTWSAAWSAARSAESAARSAAAGFAWSAAESAAQSAWSAMRVWQTDRLFGYLDGRAVVREP